MDKSHYNLPDSYRYCPVDKHQLEVGDDGIKFCPVCKFKHYNNPTPVVAVIVASDEGIVLVRRAKAPFESQWCLPCGFMDAYEHPKAAASREVLEETGLEVRVEKILSVCNASPADYPLNQIVIHYLARVVGGSLQAGDDAMDARFFVRRGMPQVCFRSHRMVIEEWFQGTWGSITGVDL